MYNIAATAATARHAPSNDTSTFAEWIINVAVCDYGQIIAGMAAG
jgi:hypothetical protein